MRSHGQYCPIAKAVEVLGERWSFLVVRELLLGSRRFNDLARGLPTMSRSLLTKRLRQLESAGVVERLDGDYVLTPAGEELRPIVFGLGEWCARWLLEDPAEGEADAELLMWWGHPRFDTTALPDRRVVLEFRFADDRRRFWVVSEDVGCSVCHHDPGFGVDAVVETDAATLGRIWYGRLDVRDAVRSRAIRFSGPRAITRRLPAVLTLADPSEVGDGLGAPRPRRHGDG